MNTTVLYTEKQRLNQWWLWAILLGINGIAVFGLIKQVILGDTFGSKPMSNIGLIAFMLFTVAFAYFFTQIKLVTQITQEGIAIKFTPFQFKFKLYKWSEIANCYVRKYQPLWEFGGWGIKYGSNGMAYNISGNMGIQLEFLDNRKILIGTNKPDEVQKVIQSIENLRQNA
jgi:Family of unknown function (DUF6141)